MRRRPMLALSGTALATALAGCSALGAGGDETPTDTESPGTTPDQTDTPETTEPQVPADVRNGSFEDDWTAWEIGRDLPTDPNAETDRAVASEVAISTRNTAVPGTGDTGAGETTDGVTSLRLFVDGSQDDGTVWVQQPVDLSGYDYLAVDYRVSTSFNEILQAAVYAGPTVEGGLSESDFDRSNSLSGHDAEGWKTFVYEVDHDGPGVVAVGTSIVWETGASALLDNVRLTEAEPERVTPTPPTSTTDDGVQSG